MSTPLHFASENGHFEICKLLIENMVHKNPATLDSDLWTPLHFAARFNHLGICRFVLLGLYYSKENPVLLWSEKEDRFAFVGFTGNFWHKIENFMKTKIKNSKEKH